MLTPAFDLVCNIAPAIEFLRGQQIKLIHIIIGRAVSAEVCLLTIGPEGVSALTIYDTGYSQQFTDEEDDKLKLHIMLFI